MELFDLVKCLVKAFEALGIPYFITGSVASIIYGEPRFTNDIDVVADIKEDQIRSVLRYFPEDEFYVSAATMRDAIRNKGQFNIIHPSSGLKIDVIIRKENAFDQSRFQRIKKVSPIEHEVVNFSSPEDVIIMKMKYYQEGQSEKHLRDITSMLKISGDSINTSYIEQWAERLNVFGIWRAVIEKVGKG
jgi:hypothetical protein